MISQVNIYMMDIVWILRDVYVWRSKFNVLYSFVKNLLHKFESKGPWMLKTDSLIF